MTIRVGVIGATGRMGSEVRRAVEEDDDLHLVARIGRGDSLEVLPESGAEVAVDFTTPEAVKQNVDFCLEHGVHAVVGTTGLGTDDLEDIERRAEKHSTNVFVAPNFAIGAVLMMDMAQRAAPFFRAVEIIERHHERKLDAPSGTALRTAGLIGDARREAWPGVERRSGGRSRGEESSGVQIHSVRLPGSIAHQEVIFGGVGETLTIRHDSLDRSSFMPGVLLAIKKVSSLPGLTVGLEHLLGL
jgi:4-hydroxy-tetrahydrodipicolinate reductase